VNGGRLCVEIIFKDRSKLKPVVVVVGVVVVLVEVDVLVEVEVLVVLSKFMHKII